MKKIYLIRHGETEGNLGNFFQFHDTPLTEAGHAGAAAVAKRFADVLVDQVVASSFTRAQQTAKYLSEEKNIPVTTVESFHESLRPARLRGKPHDDDDGEAHKEVYKTEYWNREWDEEGAENYFDVIERVKAGIHFLEASDAEHIAVVSHGHLIKTLTAFLLLSKNDELDFNRAVFTALESVSNVGITEFTFEDGVWKLVHYNDIAHFAE